MEKCFLIELAKNKCSLLFAFLFSFSFNNSIFAQHTRIENANHISANYFSELPKGNTKIVRQLSFGRAAILIDGKWGFIDKKDNLIIKAQYDLVYDFTCSATAVMKGSKWFVIDDKGKMLNPQYFDYVGPFLNGQAKVVLKNKFSFIYENGMLAKKDWKSFKPTSKKLINNSIASNIGCPANFDFDFGDFTNWLCDTGSVVGPTNSINGVSTNGSNQIINSAVTPPLPNKHVIFNNATLNPPDPFGGFSVNSPDGSNFFIKLGSDLPDGGFDPLYNNPWPAGKTESVFYDYFIPPNIINLSFSYDFAVVLNEPIPVLDPVTGIYSPPIHLFDDKPRFKVEIIDLATNQIVPCGKLEYVADPTSAGVGGFLQSPLSNAQNTIWYKPWSKRFVNLAPYHGKNIRIKFTTADCTLGGHWGYAYLDIEGCLNMASATRTCSSPVKTVLDGPAGFQTYEWYTNDFSTHLGSGIHLVAGGNLLNVGDTVNLIATPAPIPFLTLTCPDTLKVIVQGPTLSFEAGPDKIFCEGKSAFIGSTPLNNAIYSWVPATGLNNTTSSLVLASPTQSVTYYVTVTDTATSCITKDSVKITVNPSPHVVVNTTPSCHNQQSTITVSGGDNYNWTPNSTLSVAPGNPSVATISAPDSGLIYHVSVGLNTSSCIVDTNIFVAAFPIPIVDFFAPPPMCLVGNLFSFTSGSFINPGTISKNTWVINGAPPIYGDGANVSFPAVGVYPVKLISTSDQGCKDSVTRNLEVLAMPKAVFSVQNSQCLSNNNFKFINASTTSTGNITSFLWNFGDNQFASDTPATHQYILPGNYTVKLTVIADNGCTDTTSRRLKVYTMPIADFQQPDSQCLRGNIFTFSALSTSVPPSTITTNQWYLGGNSNPIAGSSITHSFATPGTYSIKLVSTSSEGCKDSISQILMVYPEPVANFALPSTICFLNNNFLFRSSSTVSNGFIDSCFWDFGDGKLDTGNTIRHPYTNPNVINYQIQLIAQTNFGCRDTLPKSFSFLPSPQVSILPLSSLSMCSGDSIRLNAVAQTPSGSITSYQWSVGGTNIPGANTPSITVHTSGIYQIEVFNSLACNASSGNDTIVVHPLPEGNVVLPNTDFICENGNKLLVCNSNALTYQWYLNGAMIPNATSANFLATQPGIYSVKLFSSFGCMNFANGSIALSIRNRPKVDFSFPTYCKNIPVQFVNLSDTAASGPINWLWNFGDGSFSQLSNPQHVYLDSGINIVKLTASSIDCPLLVSDSQIVVHIQDTIPGIRYPFINTTPNTNVNLQSRDFGSSVLWMPSSGLNNANVSNPVFNYNREVEYIIRVRNLSGCPTHDTLLVRIFEKSDFQVPTAFTPNGDGHNDYLDYFLIGIDKFKRFMVFNRWGQLLFETTDPRQRWDGTFQGKKQPVETYVWLAEGDDSKGITIFRRGQTILLR